VVDALASACLMIDSCRAGSSARPLLPKVEKQVGRLLCTHCWQHPQRSVPGMLCVWEARGTCSALRPLDQSPGCSLMPRPDS